MFASAPAAASVLVVDDDTDVCELLREVFELQGFATLVAHDLARAHALMRHARFDILVTDLSLPGGSGMELLRAARSLDPIIEVLILTGHGSIATAVEAMQLGAFDYLTKPVGPKALLAKTRQALERRQLRSELERQRAEIESYQAALARDLAVAARVQASLVPGSLEADRYAVAVRYQPMLSIGGDFADVHVDASGVLTVAILDVTGHGIAAALLVNRLSVELRRLMRAGDPPGAILTALDRFITESFSGTGMIASSFVCRYDPESGVLSHAGAGHPPLLLRRAGSGRVELHEAMNTLIGGDLNAGEYWQGDTRLEPGDVVLLYTDGLIEVENHAREWLGLEGLARILTQARETEVDQLADRIVVAVGAHRAGIQRDDVYLVALQARSAPDAGSPAAA